MLRMTMLNVGAQQFNVQHLSLACYHSIICKQEVQLKPMEMSKYWTNYFRLMIVQYGR